ncbi:MAG TPA: hypothetical protein VF644_13185 [Pyrinomonadaceae bacterium]|jgi:hypothetical protein
MKIRLVFVLLTIFSSIAAAQSDSKEKIALQLGNTIVNENGKSVIESKGACGSGEVLAFHLPQKGWFIASVEPLDGYDFQKIGKLEGNFVTFEIDGNRYEIISNQPISRQTSSLDLWVVRVPTPTDKVNISGTAISCASDFKYWLKTNLPKNQKK